MPEKPAYEPIFRPGSRLRVWYEATVSDQDGPLPPGTLPLRRGGRDWFEEASQVHVEVIPPDVVPGCCVTANGIGWVVRESAKHVSLRVMPWVLRGRNKTLPIEEFYRRYPKARVIFDPRWEGIRFLEDVAVAVVYADDESLEAIRDAARAELDETEADGFSRPYDGPEHDTLQERDDAN